MDMIELRRRLMAQMAGTWKQKHVVIPANISLGGGFVPLFPAEASKSIIVKDEWSDYVNNQLVFGVYTPDIGSANSFCRYRDNNYNHNSGSIGLWGDTYALAASQGDKYTIFYQ